MKSTFLVFTASSTIVLAACGARVSVCSSDVGGGGGGDTSSSSGSPGCLTDADCNDGLGCTDDACDDGQCHHEAVVGCVTCEDHADCDDGNPCTADRCNTEGACDYSQFGDGSLCSTAAVGEGQCMLGQCCFAGSCMDPVSGNCHDTCPFGTACIDFVCQ